MNRIRLLSLLVLACAAGTFVYVQRSGVDPIVRQCLIATDTAMARCNDAYAVEYLTDEERGFVAFRLGYLHDVAGDWNRAISYYTTSIDLTPQRAAAFLNRGVLLRKHDVDLNAALEDFSSYLASGKDDVRALTERARTYRNMDELALAAADLDQAATIDPQDQWLFRERALLLQDQDNDAAALAVLNEAIAIHSDSLWLWRERSWVKRQLSDYEGAMQDIVHVIGADPAPMWPWFQRGWLNMQMHNYDLALTDLQTALAKDPGYRPAQRQMRHLMRNIQVDLRGQPERLSAFADAGLVNDPDNTELIYLRALAQRDAGKFVGALNDINRLIAAADHPQTLIFLRSTIHLVAGQYDRALADLEFLTRDPSAHDAAMQQIAEDAATLRDEGKDAEAAMRDSDVGDLASLYTEAMRARIAIYRVQSDWGSALEALELLAAYDPDDSRHWTERGDVLEQLGRRSDAMESYSKAIRLIESGAADGGNIDAYHANALLRRGALHQAQRRTLSAHADFAAAMTLGNTDLIRAFQQKMLISGHYGGPLNGIFDAATQAALHRCAADPAC